MASKVFIADYLVYIHLVCFLTERVTIVNIGNLLKHFPDLLSEFDISSCKANSNLCYKRQCFRFQDSGGVKFL